MLDLTSAPPGVDLWFRFPFSVFTFQFVLFLRNNLRRMLFYYFMYVEGDNEEDDEGGHADAEEEGHDGGYEMLGNHFRYCPLLQELAEEDNGRDGKYACHTYEPEVEAAKEQGYVFALGAVNLA